MLRRFINTASMYVASFILTVFLAIIFLFAGTYLPNRPIEQNLIASLPVFEREGMYNHSGDYSEASKLDGFTDALILQGSLLARWADQKAILTNPFYGDPSYPVDALINLLENEEYIEYGEPDWCYARYWMGFRTPMRLLLTLFNYQQIRTLISNVFFILLALCACLVAHYIGAKAAFAFLASVFLVKPQIICNSLQYSSCFLIAFGAMVCIPFIYLHPKLEQLFFFELGMVTMYFDFYTIPTVAFGFPFIFLLLLKASKGKRLTMLNAIRCFAVFLIGWVLMWIAKLLLTNIFTDVDGILSGLESMARRVGLVKNTEILEYYSIPYALQCVIETIFPAKVDWAMAAVGFMLGVAYVVYMSMTKRFHIENAVNLPAMLFVACIPVIWFAATAQPTSIHAFFQYRNIALTYFAAGSCIHLLSLSNDNNK